MTRGDRSSQEIPGSRILEGAEEHWKGVRRLGLPLGPLALTRSQLPKILQLV